MVSNYIVLFGVAVYRFKSRRRYMEYLKRNAEGFFVIPAAFGAWNIGRVHLDATDADKKDYQAALVALHIEK